jgi:hypothetical protein
MTEDSGEILAKIADWDLLDEPDALEADSIQAAASLFPGLFQPV